EYMLLRRALQKRIGTVAFAQSFQIRLWIAALSAAIAAVAFDRFAAVRIAAHLPLRHIAEAVLVAGIFGVVYFVVAFALGVPEAMATLRRFRR
ncbi:MAG TPA: hypothetical protein VN181_03900, partial [Thermoanaerobaculia bacterium]|nr:hypothetical protein [Thermoanaerobaculia bacterium]